jgi:MFS family permease
VIRRPGAIVALLTGLNLLNFLDRWLISAISPDIKRELGLSDWQTGIVLNAFLVGFMLTSPIFGRLGDALPRKWLIAAGVTVWCLATAGSGLMVTFGALVAVRMLVGLGEASYSSLAPTILDDLASPARKGRVLAVFLAAIPIGSALGFVIGGQLDAHYGWRSAFFIAGGPGLLLALACPFMLEPPRSHDRRTLPPIGHTLRELARSPRYVWAVLGAIPQTAVLGCFGSWAPHYLERRFHMRTADADGIFGIVIVVTGFVGSFLGGAWYDAAKRGRPDEMKVGMEVCRTSALVAAPLTLACLLAGTPTLFFTFSALAQIAIWASLSPFNAVLLGAVPSAMRATGIALSIFATHAFGDLPAIPLVGLLSDRIGDLPRAMMSLPAAMVVSAMAWMVGARVTERTAIVPASTIDAA